jgi:hypothetical protein
MSQIISQLFWNMSLSHKIWPFTLYRKKHYAIISATWDHLLKYDTFKLSGEDFQKFPETLADLAKNEGYATLSGGASFNSLKRE